MIEKRKFRTPLWWGIVCLVIAWALFAHAHHAHAFGFSPGGTGGSDLSGGAAPDGTGGGWADGGSDISCGGCGASGFGGIGGGSGGAGGTGGGGVDRGH